MPGLPGIVIGRNDRIAWGVTNVGADVEDLYLLEEVEGRGYRYKGRVVLRGAGGKDPGEGREGGGSEGTGDGLWPRDHRCLKDPPKTPMALRWVSLDPEDHILMAFLGVNRARNWEEFQKALEPTPPLAKTLSTPTWRQHRLHRPGEVPHPQGGAHGDGAGAGERGVGLAGLPKPCGVAQGL